MRIQSQKAREIDAHLSTHPDAKVGNWPLEIAGQKKILEYYRFPTKLLRYNANNGRLAMEKREWEEKCSGPQKLDSF